jgi:MFS superfamily sulfate permease-like transporter
VTGLERDWQIRVLGIVVLLAVYLVLWNPVRGILAQDVAAPAIERAASVEMEPGRHPAVTQVADDERRRWSAPAGLSFLIGAFLLIAAAPRPGYLAAFFAAHVTLGVLSAVTLVTWIRGGPGGEMLYHLVDTYLVDGITLATMALAVTAWRIPLRKRRDEAVGGALVEAAGRDYQNTSKKNSTFDGHSAVGSERLS